MREQLEASEVYRQWSAAHKEAYLAQFFCKITPSGATDIWEANVYDPLTKEVTTFVLGNEVTIKGKSPVLQELQPIGEMQESYAEAFNKVVACLQEHYKAEHLGSGFVVFSDKWEFTFITTKMHFLQVKVGDVITHKLITDVVNTL